MTNGYYCAIFSFCGGGKKKDNKKTKAFYDWATTGTPVTIEYLTPGATLKAGTTERWNGAMVQWRTGAMADGGK